MSEFEKAEEQEILDAMARQAGYERTQPVAKFVLVHELPEFGVPFGIYHAQPPIAPNVRHINRQRGGEGWTDPPQAA